MKVKLKYLESKEGIRISKLCEMLNVPFSMSFSTWYDHEEVLRMAHEEVVQEQLTLNKAEARKLNRRRRHH